MAGLRPLLLPEAVGQQRSVCPNATREHSLSDASSARPQTQIEGFIPSTSLLSPSRLFSTFRLPIISSLPVLQAISHTNFTGSEASNQRKSTSLYPNLRTKSFSELSSFFSDLENLRTSTPKLSIETPSPSDVDRLATLCANSDDIQEAVANDKISGRVEHSKNFFREQKHKSSGCGLSDMKTPLKLRYSTLFNALCIADPTSSNHPIRLQTPAYRLTRLGLPQFTETWANNQAMASTIPNDNQSWSIVQERGVDGRPKFYLQWRGTLQSFIPGRGRLFLGSQIDITSSFRGMATFEITRRSRQEMDLADVYMESSTIGVFTQLIKDIKMQYQRFIILQPKPRSRIPTRSPGSPPNFTAPTLSLATATSTSRSPPSPRLYPRLTDYAITFASMNIHQDGLGVRINFSRTPSEVAAVLEKRLAGRDSFEMAVRWGVEDNLLWLMAIPLLEGATKWWVCFLLDCDDEIF